MKKFTIITAILSCLFTVLIPTIHAETVREAVEKCEKQATVDREKFPVFAIETSKLASSQLPKEIIEAATDLGSASTTRNFEKSRVDIDGLGDDGIVKFTIRCSASSVTQADGSTYVQSSNDPLVEQLKWVLGIRESGLVFGKNIKDEVSMGIPGRMAWDSITNDTYRHACDRFGVETTSYMPSPIPQGDFLKSLMEKGILTRKALKEKLDAEFAKVQNLIKAHNEPSGFIKFSHLGEYLLTQGKLLTAEKESSSSGKNIYLHIFNEEFSNVQIELQYSDGSPIVKSSFGFYKYPFPKENFRRTRISWFNYIEIDYKMFGMIQKNRKVQILGSVEDPSGNLILDKQVIGEFEIKE